MISEDERRRRIAAYEGTETDAEAGRAIGMARTSYGRWRRKEGLPRKHPPVAFDRDAFMDAYEKAGRDLDIARELGVDPQIALKWRRNLGLPPKGLPFGHRKHVSNAEIMQTYGLQVEAIASGRVFTDKEAAKQVGLSITSYRERLRLLNLVAPYAKVRESVRQHGGRSSRYGRAKMRKMGEKLRDARPSGPGFWMEPCQEYNIRHKEATKDSLFYRKEFVEEITGCKISDRKGAEAD